MAPPSSPTGPDVDVPDLRSVAAERGTSLVSLFVEYLSAVRTGKIGPSSTKAAAPGGHTLLAVCPTSPAVTRAALRAADRAGAPLLYAATLNQVDRDGGYTGWTPAAFADFVDREADRMDVDIPIVLGLDHGGPWKKDRHVLEDLSYDETQAEVRTSIAACIDAGYELLHLDPTTDRRLPPGEEPAPDQIAERTLDLLRFAEKARRDRGRPPLAYEVGTEESGSGLDTQDRFHAFLDHLDAGLRETGLPAPAFVVGDVGTRLDTSRFDPEQARSLAGAARSKVGALVKGHYTDDVADLAAYPMSGMGGANVGPGLAAVERSALSDLVDLEERIGPSSGLGTALREAVVTSGRWRKWVDTAALEPGADADALRQAFDALPEDRQHWLVATGSRYVWSHPSVQEARARLYENVSPYRDARAYVEWRIETEITRYLHAFHLIGFLRRFRDWLSH